MSRSSFNALVDAGCLVAFIPTAISGLVLYFVLPSGGGRWSGWTLFAGIPRNQWMAIHNYAGLAFIVLLMLHLLLHWRYFLHICRHLRSGEGQRERE